MSEKERIRELLSYKILDTSPEKELDEIAEIASAICNTPISLITLVDSDRQWFKSRIGIDAEETPREHAFCEYALNKPNELLIVTDPLNDIRFKDNPYVTKDPNIRFYAGAPLQTPSGYVLGTLCVIDNKPNRLSDVQKRALELLARKAMSFLNARKLLIEQNKHIENSITQLKNLTDQAPGVLYQLQMTSRGKVFFTFLSKGVSEIHASLSTEILKEKPDALLNIIHPEDLDRVLRSFRTSFNKLTLWYTECRIMLSNGGVKWYMIKAKPEKQRNGAVIWYGAFQDITQRKEYEKTLEQILFDISHVIRAPVVSLLGLTSLIENDYIDNNELKNYAGHIKRLTKELDSLTIKLNVSYHEKSVDYNQSRSFQQRID